MIKRFFKAIGMGSVLLIAFSFFLFSSPTGQADEKEKKKEVQPENPLLKDSPKWISPGSKSTEPAREEVQYVNYKKEGKTKIWLNNGGWIEGEYSNGEKNGIWIQYGPTGKKVWQESYKNGLKHGDWISYDAKENKVKQESYKDGLLDGKMIIWSTKNGIKTYEKDFRNGKAHGKELAWFEDGRLSRDNGYIDGKPHGHNISWNLNGQKHFEGNYVNGTGKFKGWYPSGKLFCEGEKRDGRSFGKETWWYESGKIEREQNFDEDGKHDGMFYHWYEDGRVKIEIIYDHGRTVSSKAWDKDGNLTYDSTRDSGEKKN